MTDCDRLEKLLRTTPYLSADTVTGEVCLLCRADADLVEGDMPFAKTFLMDLQKSLRGFSASIGREDKSYSLNQIAQISGLTYNAAYRFAREVSVLVPSLKGFDKNDGTINGFNRSKFSFGDAFAACVIATLYRFGFGINALRQVQPLLQQDALQRIRERLQKA